MESVGNCDGRNKGCLKALAAQEGGQLVFSADAGDGHGLELSSAPLAALGSDCRGISELRPRMADPDLEAEVQSALQFQSCS